jgi:hypothetical protein
MPKTVPASSSRWRLAVAVIAALVLIGLASLAMVQMPGALSSMLAGLFTF